jgi:hypothetical protein
MVETGLHNPALQTVHVLPHQTSQTRAHMGTDDSVHRFNVHVLTQSQQHNSSRFGGHKLQRACFCPSIHNGQQHKK